MRGDNAMHDHTSASKRRPEPRFHARPQDIERWHAAARDAGAGTFASWARDALNAAASCGTTAGELRSELHQLRTELARGIGNNLNQLVRQLNTLAATGRAPAAQVSSLAFIEVDVRQALRRIDAALGKLGGGPSMRKRRPLGDIGFLDPTAGMPGEDEGLPRGLLMGRPR